MAGRVMEVRTIAAGFADPSSRRLVYGDRRLGKSSVVGAAADNARRNGTPVVVVDLAKVTSLEGAAQAILASVHKELGRRWKELATSLIGRFRRSNVSIGAQPDPAGGMPTFTFAVTAPADMTEQPGSVLVETLDAVEAEMATRKQPIGIALDEFQRLSAWEPEIDWLLKGVFDSHRHISYVLAGSERAVIDGMIASKAKGGLYKMVDVLNVGPIPILDFATWIRSRADATGLLLDETVAAALIAAVGPRTRDVVQLARALWDATHERGTATIDAVEETLDELVAEQGAHHQATWERLKTDTHRRILVLIAANPSVELTASKTLHRYRLGAKTSVNRTLKRLIAEEHVVATKTDLRLDDPFFMRWIELNAFKEFNFPMPSLKDRLRVNR